MKTCFNLTEEDGCFSMLDPTTGCFTLLSDASAAEDESEKEEPPIEIVDFPIHATGIHSDGHSIYLSWGKPDWNAPPAYVTGIMMKFSQDMEIEDRPVFVLEQTGTFPMPQQYEIRLDARDNKNQLSYIHAGYGREGTWIDPAILSIATPSPEYMPQVSGYFNMEDGAERVLTSNEPNYLDTITGWYIPSDSDPKTGETIFLNGAFFYRVYRGPKEKRSICTFRGYWHRYGSDGEWMFDLDTFALFPTVASQYPPTTDYFDWRESYVESKMILEYMSNSDRNKCDLAIGTIDHKPPNNLTVTVIVEGAYRDNALSLKYEKDHYYNEDNEYTEYMNARVMSGTYWMVENYAFLDNCQTISAQFGWCQWNDMNIVISGTLIDNAGTEHQGWFWIKKPKISGRGAMHLTWEDVTERVTEKLSELPDSAYVLDKTLHKTSLIFLVHVLNPDHVMYVEVRL